MKPEIEAKFLHVEFDELRAKLTELGATCVHPMRLMRRVVLDYADRDGQKIEGWIRVRDEGDKITVTFKTTEEKKFGGTTEIEVVVSDFDKTIAIFESIAPIKRAYQESKRETWQLGEAEVVLDEWPWLDPYVEIEASSESMVKDTAKKLGFRWEDAAFGSVTTAYREQYPSTTVDKHVSSIPEIKFGAEKPVWFGESK